MTHDQNVTIQIMCLIGIIINICIWIDYYFMFKKLNKNKSNKK